jgi:hypothetical protein
MNMKLAEVWNLSTDEVQDSWQDLYNEQLFLAKKELRSHFQVPKLFNKKWSVYHQWAQLENPEWCIVEKNTMVLPSLQEYEMSLMLLMNQMERVVSFSDLAQLGSDWMVLMEAYRDLIYRITEVWPIEWLHVEVNSREIFPLGAFLYGTKQGASIEDYKIPLLKERKRITIVY